MNPIALTGIFSPIKPDEPAELWIVFIPKGDQTVPQSGDVKLRVNPSRLSAQRMEAARQLIAKKGGNQPYTDFNHDDQEASGRPKRFGWRDDLGVVGLVRRTHKAVEMTSGDPPEYQAFSPHVPMDGETGEALGLYMNCGGFVNRPLFGDSTSLLAAAHLTHELVAADPNDVAQIDAALREAETTPAAKMEKNQMKELIAKLCAVFKIDAAGKTDEALQPLLISAFEKSQTAAVALTAKADLVDPVIVAFGLPKETLPKVEVLTARASLLAPLLIALGFAADATPKPEELTAKITDLSKPSDELIGKEIVEFATSAGIIAPAEKAEWLGKMKRDRVGWQKELAAKAPTVLVGKVVKPADAAAAAGGGEKEPKAWEKRVEELCAKDPTIKAVMDKDPVKARSMAIERIAKDEPALLEEPKPKAA
jgi:hypothetical protein